MVVFQLGKQWLHRCHDLVGRDFQCDCMWPLNSTSVRYNIIGNICVAQKRRRGSRVLKEERFSIHYWRAQVPGSQRRTVLNTLMEGRSPRFSKKDGSQDTAVLNTLLLQGVFVFRETVLILLTEPQLKFSELVLLFFCSNLCPGLVMFILFIYLFTYRD